MSAKFEIYYPMLASKLEQNALAVAGWGMLGAVLFGALFVWSFAVDARMPKLPIAMQEEVPNKKKRIDIFIKDTRRLLIDSYNKIKSLESRPQKVRILKTLSQVPEMFKVIDSFLSRN
ncbi:hypothetical protein NW754_010421 [Fusarium falciforme]|nr:hypothetical protein NW754_010421 [Fusarium falciforme]